jgi:hypothetical protein
MLRKYPAIPAEKPVARAIRAAEPPRVDGDVLNDSVWAAVESKRNRNVPLFVASLLVAVFVAGGRPHATLTTELAGQSRVRELPVAHDALRRDLQDVSSLFDREPAEVAQLQ